MSPANNNYKARFYKIQKLNMTRAALYICSFTFLKSVKRSLTSKV